MEHLAVIYYSFAKEMILNNNLHACSIFSDLVNIAEPVVFTIFRTLVILAPLTSVLV